MIVFVGYLFRSQCRKYDPGIVDCGIQSAEFSFDCLKESFQFLCFAEIGAEKVYFARKFRSNFFCQPFPSSF